MSGCVLSECAVSWQFTGAPRHSDWAASWFSSSPSSARTRRLKRYVHVHGAGLFWSSVLPMVSFPFSSFLSLLSLCVRLGWGFGGSVLFINLLVVFAVCTFILKNKTSCLSYTACRLSVCISHSLLAVCLYLTQLAAVSSDQKAALMKMMNDILRTLPAGDSNFAAMKTEVVRLRKLLVQVKPGETC